jgi:hypothetical protein
MSVTSDQILETLGPRGAIAEAVDILKSRHGISEDDAFDMLVRVSCDAQAKVRETAGRIVAVAAGQWIIPAQLSGTPPCEGGPPGGHGDAALAAGDAARRRRLPRRTPG